MKLPNDMSSISPCFGLNAKVWSGFRKTVLGKGGEEKRGKPKGSAELWEAAHTPGLTPRWQLSDHRKHTVPHFRSAFKTSFLVVQYYTNFSAPPNLHFFIYKMGHNRGKIPYCM